MASRRYNVNVRSSSREMQSLPKSSNEEQGTPQVKIRRKPAEAFVPWKRSVVLEDGGGRESVPKSVLHAKGKQRKVPIQGSSGNVQSPLARPMFGGQEILGRTTVVSTKGGRRTNTPSCKTIEHGDTSGNRQQELSTGTASKHRRCPAARDLEGFSSIEKEVALAGSPSTRTVPKELFSRSRDRRFAVLRSVWRTDTSVRTGSDAPEEKSTVETERAVSNVGQGSGDDPAVEEELSPLRKEQQKSTETWAEHEDEEEDIPLYSSQQRNFPRGGATSCTEEYPEDYADSDAEDRGDAADVVVEASVDERRCKRDVQVVLYPTEAERKKERRQEKAWREKEGDRRRKQGVPRNFLLVDEYSKKPCGVRVGDWRKELMLLSRDLDPSIENINRHPEGAVAEIAEWIQHTWEYSSPVKFEYVKEVIAKGVTLRRDELWRKIRNGEPSQTECQTAHGAL